MMDGIINFDEIKNKAKDKDVDKLEQYIYSLYYSLAQGEITMGDLSKSISEYMEKNNISQEKFLNMQQKLMERYGVSNEDIANQMKNMGIDIPNIDQITDYEKMRKTLSFKDKYGSKLTTKAVNSYFIKNDINEVEILMNEENITIKSPKNVDLNDNELNEFLCSYKKLMEEKLLNIHICENMKNYNY
ncbi:MAG: DUF3867 domain-containing protein [Clostridium sp.]|uniref:DUF3867 domain-containing protein n=1 Tax=Clostridium sp. TaxID=1506 RepID=UPI002A8D7851|nr:DUF3867 domain-containing protein [Clostridium sp.]MDY5099400.1 DUF3867 domain-containing protein [Clostridium sp.]